MALIPEPKKNPLLSKTLIINLVIALSALFAPGVKEYIAEHPEAVAVGFSVLNMVLRAVTKKKLSFEK